MCPSSCPPSRTALETGGARLVRRVFANAHGVVLESRGRDSRRLLDDRVAHGRNRLALGGER
ncbi:protein of unknown function [Paraburkholderia kururiensis]